jgi:hypothetical protein
VIPSIVRDALLQLYLLTLMMMMMMKMMKKKMMMMMFWEIVLVKFCEIVLWVVLLEETLL